MLLLRLWDHSRCRVFLYRSHVLFTYVYAFCSLTNEELTALTSTFYSARRDTPTMHHRFPILTNLRGISKDLVIGAKQMRNFEHVSLKAESVSTDECYRQCGCVLGSNEYAARRMISPGVTRPYSQSSTVFSACHRPQITKVPSTAPDIVSSIGLPASSFLIKGGYTSEETEGCAVIETTETRL